MGWLSNLPSLRSPIIWTRDAKGNNFSDVTEFDNWTKQFSNLGIAQNHPILTPALLFVSKTFSQAEFVLQRNSTKKIIDNHPVLDLLNNPNIYQTLPDLLESLMFTQKANGVGVLYKKRNILSGSINSIYVLDYSLIKFPEEIKKGGNFINKSQGDKYLEQKIIYDISRENKKIKLKDLMFFYDLPNGVDRNPFVAESLLTGLKQTLTNTKDSFIAKNIILKSNGKELISGTKDGFPLGKEEKAELENLYKNKYGVSFNRKRGIITQGSLTHKSLHIALRDLGLDESVKTDGNVIYTALHIPKDIISLEAKKTTYNNFKESMVSYLQNEMQSSLDSFVAVLNKDLLDSGMSLIGSYEHLPIMQYILIERYKGVNERMIAFTNARKSGLPDEMCLELVGLPKDTVLGDLAEPQTATEGSEENGDEPIDEEKIREIINELVYNE